MSRADRGLFHGKMKQYGNKISFSHRAYANSSVYAHVLSFWTSNHLFPGTGRYIGPWYMSYLAEESKRRAVLLSRVFGIVFFIFTDMLRFFLVCSTRRSWTPNIQNKKLRSELLSVTLKVPLTTKTLRCIDKSGTCFVDLNLVFLDVSGGWSTCFMWKWRANELCVGCVWCFYFCLVIWL